MNMARMVVTLDVSRLSGWLNADEYCHSTGGHTKRGARRGQGDGGGRGAAAVDAVCRGKARLDGPRAGRCAPKT